MTSTAPAVTFGDVLRGWREVRRYSQLALAGAAEVSQRHLSFLETGRSKPSREMVLHLAGVLDLPLRERNQLLAAAGFAAEFVERPLDHPELDEIRGVLTTLVEGHGHIPAYVVDRGWDIVLPNAASVRLLDTLGIDLPAGVAGNVVRSSLHPDGLRRVMPHWPDFAAAFMRRLEREAAERPFDDRLGALLTDVRAYPGVPTASSSQGGRGGELVSPMVLDTPVGRLRLFSMIASIGDAFDVTLDELRLETLLPADRSTESILKGRMP